MCLGDIPALYVVIYGSLQIYADPTGESYERSSRSYEHRLQENRNHDDVLFGSAEAIVASDVRMQILFLPVCVCINSRHLSRLYYSTTSNAIFYIVKLF